MVLEQIAPLPWRYLPDSSRSARLSISLLDNPAETVFPVTAAVALSEGQRILGALRSPLAIDFFPVLPIRAAPTRPLLLEFYSAFFAVVFVLPFSSFDAIFAIPRLSLVAFAPAFGPEANFAEILPPPRPSPGSCFFGMSFAPFARPFALILALVRKVFPVPLLLIRALVVTVSAYPTGIGKAPLPISSSACL